MFDVFSRAAGVTTVLNAAPARADVPEALLAATDILCVNQTEAEVMSGKDEVDAAALALRSKGCRCVIVTLVKPPSLFPNSVSSGCRGSASAWSRWRKCSRVWSSCRERGC